MVSTSGLPLACIIAIDASMCSRWISGSDRLRGPAGSVTSNRYACPSTVKAVTRRFAAGSSAIELNIRPSGAKLANRKRPGTSWSIACQIRYVPSTWSGIISFGTPPSTSSYSSTSTPRVTADN
jgi:hypothetical protein